MNRRKFLANSCKACSAMAAGAAFSRLGMIDAFAQNVTPNTFQALVCVFLYGGNDANNMVIPIDTAGYNAYSSARGSAITIPQAQILPLTFNGAVSGQPYTQFGVHPAMPEVQALFANKNLAFSVNTGTLVSPTTKNQYTGKLVTLPSNLFSHSDQQNQWQTGSANSFSTSGWAGRLADIMVNDNPVPGSGTVPSIISLSGAPIFGTGIQTQQMSVGTGTIVAANCGTGSSSNQCRTNEQIMLGLDSGAAMVAQASAVTSNAFNYANTLNTDLTGITLATPTPAVANTLVPQLTQVAKILKVRSSLNMKRQIFFVSMGGFDNHTSQGIFNPNLNLQTTKQDTTQPYLLQQLSQALNYFWNVLGELGIQNQVTTFTCSDFSRTFKGNAGLGSDHAWGSHHMVMGGSAAQGGALLGGQFYGTYPTLALGGPSDADTSNASGRWIPTNSMAQYGAALASWFGVQNANLPTVFPEFPNFNNQKLAFLG